MKRILLLLIVVAPLLTDACPVWWFRYTSIIYGNGYDHQLGHFHAGRVNLEMGRYGGRFGSVYNYLGMGIERRLGQHAHETGFHIAINPTRHSIRVRRRRWRRRGYIIPKFMLRGSRVENSREKTVIGNRLTPGFGFSYIHKMNRPITFMAQLESGYSFDLNAEGTSGMYVQAGIGIGFGLKIVERVSDAISSRKYEKERMKRAPGH